MGPALIKRARRTMEVVGVSSEAAQGCGSGGGGAGDKRRRSRRRAPKKKGQGAAQFGELAGEQRGSCGMCAPPQTPRPLLAR